MDEICPILQMKRRLCFYKFLSVNQHGHARWGRKRQVNIHNPCTDAGSLARWRGLRDEKSTSVPIPSHIWITENISLNFSNVLVCHFHINKYNSHWSLCRLSFLPRVCLRAAKRSLKGQGDFVGVWIIYRVKEPCVAHTFSHQSSKDSSAHDYIFHWKAIPVPFRYWDWKIFALFLFQCDAVVQHIMARKVFVFFPSSSGKLACKSKKL